MPRHWHAIGMEFVRWDVVRLGPGCGIGRMTIFDCGELGLICQFVVVGLWFRIKRTQFLRPSPEIPFSLARGIFFRICSLFPGLKQMLVAVFRATNIGAAL